MTLNAKDKLIRGRVKTYENNPFFSYLAMNLNFEENKQITNTAGVDAKGKMYYNPEFVEKLNTEEVKTLLVHEIMHVALLHFTRLGDRHKEIFNVACDIIINNVLVKNGFAFTGEMRNAIIPRDNQISLFDGKIVIENISDKIAEEVYNELYQKAKKNNLIKRIKEIVGFDSHFYSEMGEEEKQKQEKEWKEKIVEANTLAKLRGNEPAGLSRYIEKLLESKMNWKELLYRYIVQEIPYDYTYNYPNRKSQVIGIYMPRVKKEMIDISVAIDVSGSVGKKELTEFLSEVYAIGRSFNSIRINLLFVDTAVNNHYILSNQEIEEIVNFEIKGGGGTDFRKIYEYMQREIPNSRLLVFLTDGYAHFPEAEEVKTLWCITKDGENLSNIPFGERIKLE